MKEYIVRDTAEKMYCDRCERLLTPGNTAYIPSNSSEDFSFPGLVEINTKRIIYCTRTCAEKGGFNG